MKQPRLCLSYPPASEIEELLVETAYITFQATDIYSCKWKLPSQLSLLDPPESHC